MFWSIICVCVRKLYCMRSWSRSTPAWKVGLKCDWSLCSFNAFIPGTRLHNWTDATKPIYRTCEGCNHVKWRTFRHTDSFRNWSSFFPSCILLSSLESNKIFRLHPCEQKTLRMEFFWMRISLSFPLCITISHTHTCIHMHSAPPLQSHKHTVFARVLCATDDLYEAETPLSVFISQSDGYSCFSSLPTVSALALVWMLKLLNQHTSHHGIHINLPCEHAC